MIYSSTCSSNIKHSHKRAIFELDFKNSFKKNSCFLKIQVFFILVNADNFPCVFRKTLFRSSSIFNSLSIVIIKSLTFSVFHILLLSILVHKCSNFFPEIRTLHLSEFIYIWLFSNHSKVMIECFFNLVRTKSKLLPQTQGVVSSAKIHVSQHKK